MADRDLFQGHKTKSQDQNLCGNIKERAPDSDLDSSDIECKIINFMNKTFNKKWNEYYVLAKSHYDEHGDLLIPFGYEIDGIKLGYWIHRQRKKYKSENYGKLSACQINQLESIGMIWDANQFLFASWDEKYKLARIYYTKHGNLLIPEAYEINGIKLGIWIQNLRRAYRGIINYTLTPHQINEVEKIGMEWNPQVIRQTSFEEQALFHYIKQLFPDAINRYTDLGFELDIFVPCIPFAIEFDGNIHRYNLNKDFEKNRKCQESGIPLFRIREKQCPKIDYYSYDYYFDRRTNFLSLTEMLNIIIDDIKIKYNIKKNVSVDLTRDKDFIIDQYFYSYDSNWDKNYALVKAYYEKHGNLLLPFDYKLNGVNLGKWIDHQCQAYKGNQIDRILTQERINKLEAIGIIWDKQKYNWEKKFSLAKAYYEEHGNLLIPTDYIFEEILLGRWISKQRLIYSGNPNVSGKLTQEQIDRLNEIGMVWNKKNKGDRFIKRIRLDMGK
jgi:hypothetical protein